MQYLNLTLPNAAENLALDEALLEEAEAAGKLTETLRIWEPTRPIAVVGRSSKVDGEVRQDVCRELGVVVLRRISGGAAIVTGPGCLMYALVLSYQRRPELRPVDRAHRFVLHALADALKPLVPDVRYRGTSDLAVGDRKFSGNSVRCRRDHLLYHGTLMYDFSLQLIDRCLPMPPRQPEYRDGRSHNSFLRNLPLEAAAIRQAMITAFDAVETRTDWPRQLTARLTTEKYCRREWNLRL